MALGTVKNRIFLLELVMIVCSFLGKVDPLKKEVRHEKIRRTKVFKFKVALEAIKGNRQISEISTLVSGLFQPDFGLKKRLLEQGAKNKRQVKDRIVSVSQPHVREMVRGRLARGKVWGQVVTEPEWWLPFMPIRFTKTGNKKRGVYSTLHPFSHALILL